MRAEDLAIVKEGIPANSFELCPQSFSNYAKLDN